MKVLLIVYSPEERHFNRDDDIYEGINTFLFEANDVDIRCLELVDQGRAYDFYGEDDDRPDHVKVAWTYVLHNMASGLYATEEEFVRELEGDAFNEQELKILKREDFGKWVKFREAGMNDCSDVERYYCIDLSTE